MWPLPDDKKWQFYSRETKDMPYMLLFSTDFSEDMDAFVYAFRDKYKGFNLDKVINNPGFDGWKAYATIEPLASIKKKKSFDELLAEGKSFKEINEAMKTKFVQVESIPE